MSNRENSKQSVNGLRSSLKQDVDFEPAKMFQNTKGSLDSSMSESFFKKI